MFRKRIPRRRKLPLVPRKSIRRDGSKAPEQKFSPLCRPLNFPNKGRTSPIALHYTRRARAIHGRSAAISGPKNGLIGKVISWSDGRRGQSPVHNLGPPQLFAGHPRPTKASRVPRVLEYILSRSRSQSGIICRHLPLESSSRSKALSVLAEGPSKNG